MNINPMELLKNFQGIQSKMGEFQAKLSSLTETGYAGGDMVKVEINGQMQVLDVRIAKEIISADDAGVLEELVKAAFNDAMRRMKDKINEEISSMTGGMNIPGGFPFG
ncbi:MAG: YbaB/EbfC family nucleoid-associated protein [Spirochaetes bacterium]|nr:YbaB/EbfC family nucleoid-associated protein [Spirochaetota bacterium]